MSFRTLLLLIFLVIFFVISIPLLVIAFFIGLFSEKARNAFTFYVPGKLFCWSVLFLAGANISVKGLENLKKNQTVLFVGNHKSLFDIPLLMIYSKLPVAFISKKSYKKVPLFSWWMIMLGCVFLDRNSTKQAIITIHEGIERLRKNHSMVIFPEGTRSRTDELHPFKEGSLKLAKKSKVPVLPFYIEGTRQLYEEHPFLSVKAAEVKIAFGAPIELDALPKETRKKSAQYVQSVVKSLKF